MYITLKNGGLIHPLIELFIQEEKELGLDVRGSDNPIIRPHHIYNHGLKNYDSGIIKRPA